MRAGGEPGISFRTLNFWDRPLLGAASLSEAAAYLSDCRPELGLQMAEPITLISVLLAGGYMMADATVKEITKDAYGQLKTAVGNLFGRRALQAAEKLEHEQTREEGKVELAAAIPDIRSDEAVELAPFVEKLLAAMRNDEAARSAVSHAKITLDLDIGGNILLDNIQGARDIGVRAAAKGDFTLKNVAMDPGGSSGN
jgi:hypothetical protein